MNSPWLNGWRERALMQLRHQGYETLTSYFMARGVSSLERLRDDLDIDLVPIQVEKLMRDEAGDSDSFQIFVKVMLIFGMQSHCATGWLNCSDHDRMLVLAHWGGGLGEINTPQADMVRRRLTAFAGLPFNWLPSGIDDPVIQSVFDTVVFRKALPGP